MLFFYQYFSQKNNRKRNSHHEKNSVFWKRIEPKLSFQPQMEQFGIKLYCVISILIFPLGKSMICLLNTVFF